MKNYRILIQEIGDEQTDLPENSELLAVIREAEHSEKAVASMYSDMDLKGHSHWVHSNHWPIELHGDSLVGTGVYHVS